MTATINWKTTDEEAKTLLIEISKESVLPFHIDQNSIVRRFTNGNQSLPLAVYPNGKSDNEFVVRIPRSDIAAKEMKQDSILSEYLNFYIKKTQISKVSYIESNNNPPITVHRSISGKTMDFSGQKDTLHYTQLSEKQKKFLAKDLAIFFNELHQIPIDNQTIISESNLRYYNPQKSERYKELMQQFGINMDNFETEEIEDKVCCHNDLHGGNMAFNGQKDHVLEGIFDFGMCGINYRSSDFVKLYQIDRELARLTIDEYNKISPRKVNIKDVDKQYLAWQAENLMLSEQNPQNWNEENKNKLKTVIRTTLIKFKQDRNKEKQQSSHPQHKNNKLLQLSGRNSQQSQEASIPRKTPRLQQKDYTQKIR